MNCKRRILKKYPSIEEDIIKNQIEWNNLRDIHLDLINTKILMKLNVILYLIY